MRARRAWALTALIIGTAIGDLAAQSPPALFQITVDDKHGMIDRTGKGPSSFRRRWIAR